MLPAVIDAQRPTREFAISILTGVIRDAAETLPIEIADMSVDDLESARKPTEVDYFLRKNLWKLIENAQKLGINAIEPVDIYRGICSKQAYERIPKTPLRLAWILTPPHEDKERLEAGLSIGITNLIKFISKEPTVETAGPFIKAIEFLYNRVHGPIIQKIQAQHAHLNMNKPIAAVSHDKADRLEELKSKLIEARDVGPVKAE